MNKFKKGDKVLYVNDIQKAIIGKIGIVEDVQTDYDKMVCV